MKGLIAMLYVLVHLYCFSSLILKCLGSNLIKAKNLNGVVNLYEIGGNRHLNLFKRFYIIHIIRLWRPRYYDEVMKTKICECSNYGLFFRRRKNDTKE